MKTTDKQLLKSAAWQPGRWLAVFCQVCFFIAAPLQLTDIKADHLHSCAAESETEKEANAKEVFETQVDLRQCSSRLKKRIVRNSTSIEINFASQKITQMISLHAHPNAVSKVFQFLPSPMVSKSLPLLV